MFSRRFAYLTALAAALLWTGTSLGALSPPRRPLPPPATSVATAAASPALGGRQSVPKNAEIRAIYFTGLMAGSPHGKRLAAQWRSEGGNAIVFDVKDSDGPVSFNSALNLGSHLKHPYIQDLPAWIAWLHAHGLYAIARMAVFKDERLVHEHPELAVRSRAHGGVWPEEGKLTWTDPSLPQVQQYNIALALEVARAGADEIQFDYIRFPVDGNQKDARFAYQSKSPQTPRADFIVAFLDHAQQALRPTGVHISIDVYGVMGWARQEDLDATGQDVSRLSRHCDVICPMIYPSHFFGDFDGYKVPGDAPRHFITAGMERFNHLTRGSGVVIRPWLQAFRWRTPSFGPQYIETEVAAERTQNGAGFMFWNAGNVYRVPDQVMAAMMSGGKKYFLGGFPYPVTAPPVPTGTSSASLH